MIGKRAAGVVDLDEKLERALPNGEQRRIQLEVRAHHSGPGGVVPEQEEREQERSNDRSNATRLFSNSHGPNPTIAAKASETIGLREIARASA